MKNRPIRIVTQVGMGLGVLALTAALVQYGPGVAAALPNLNDSGYEVSPTFSVTTTASQLSLSCPGAFPASPNVSQNILTDELTGGAVASWSDEGEQRGLAVGACPAPGTDFWLVGGASQAGQTANLQFSNPGTRPATVTLEVFGANGPLTLGTRSVVTVAAGEVASVPLDAIAPSQPRLAVHATATGSLVTAELATTRLDGLTAAGVELVDPTLDPSPTLVIAGLRSDGQVVDDSAAPIVRLLSPDADATAKVKVLGADGDVIVPGLDEVILKAGVPTDVMLGGIAAGEYAVIVQADQPIVGAGHWFRAIGESRDDAWISAATPAVSSAALVSGGLAATLVIVTPADVSEPITGKITGRSLRDFEIAPGSITVVEVPFDPEPGLVIVNADAPVAWGLVLTTGSDQGLVAGIAPTLPSAATTGIVTVKHIYIK